MPESMLVSGGAGFAGRHLIDLLESEGTQPVAPEKSELDLRDGAALQGLVASVAPTAIFHLAAFASPARSWERLDEALLGNQMMTLNLLEAVRREAPSATVVLVGSAQAYGEPSGMPVTEEAPLRPGNPYALSKASCDMLGAQFADRYGLRIVRMRPFNHAGPGQAEEYVVSSLARQIAEAEAAGKAECLLRTGNPDSARDFTDVRDVVRAYALAARIDSGAFNVCSGSATSIAALVAMMSEYARIEVRHEVRQDLLRPGEVSALYGSHKRFTEATDWRPEISLEVMVRDTLDWWRSRFSS